MPLTFCASQQILQAIPGHFVATKVGNKKRHANDVEYLW